MRPEGLAEGYYLSELFREIQRGLIGEDNASDDGH
jgi:hypothetical protein